MEGSGSEGSGIPLPKLERYYSMNYYERLLKNKTKAFTTRYPNKPFEFNTSVPCGNGESR